MASSMRVTCCVAGGGPAGIMLGFLLARAGVKVVVLRVLVDAIATCDYVELPAQPTIAIIAGPPVAWKAVLPTLRRCGERFRLGLKGEDKWGNPSDQAEGVFALRANLPVRRLPGMISMRMGEHALSIEGLSVSEPGDLLIEVLDDA